MNSWVHATVLKSRRPLMRSILQRGGEGSYTGAVHGEQHHVIAEHELWGDFNTDGGHCVSHANEAGAID
jgi:hypothetical protein